MCHKSKKDDPYRVGATSLHDLDTSATTEMTGLIPSSPETEAELDSYKALYPFSPDEFVD